MNQILQFLDETKVFYFATIEGDKPRVRPFGFVMEYNNRLYFGTGDNKSCYKQLKANPCFEICAYNGDSGTWMRMSGVVEFDENYETTEYVFKHSHFLRERYGDPSGPQFAPFYVRSGQAVFEKQDGNTWSVHI